MHTTTDPTLGFHPPVTIACVGLLYCKTDGVVGQDIGQEKLNLIDLSVLVSQRRSVCHLDLAPDLYSQGH
jgi:hypothetical protein